MNGMLSAPTLTLPQRFSLPLNLQNVPQLVTRNCRKDSRFLRFNQCGNTQRPVAATTRIVTAKTSGTALFVGVVCGEAVDGLPVKDKDLFNADIATGCGPDRSLAPMYVDVDTTLLKLLELLWNFGDRDFCTPMWISYVLGSLG